MNTSTRIYINNDLDIVTARMQARQVAKDMGFTTTDQARISLAASELARLLSWSTSEASEIVISNAARNGHYGLQVNCLVQLEYISGKDEGAIPTRSFVGACQLVDESNVEVHDETRAMITLIKWLK
jgi:serine/threonine-protein kinase RsbT